MANKSIPQFSDGAPAQGGDLTVISRSGLNYKLSISSIASYSWISPTLTTPSLGSATATSIAIGGAAIGTNALAVTGTSTMGSATYFPDGSASSPSIAHSGDTNCGIYFPTSDNISITTSGSERFRVDSSGRIGFSATPNTFSYMVISPTITGQTFEDTINISSVLGSDVTSAGRGIQSRVTTGAAVSYGDIIHFFVNPTSLFAGSSLANQYGFSAGATISAATNNYGFYGNLAASSGRWNFFANGTANNAFAGNSRFGGITVPVATVDVTGSVAATTTIRSSGATSGIGYAAGAGGTVAQTSSRTNGVTIDKVCGQITLVSAAGTTLWQSFTVTNSAVASTDTIIVNQDSGTDLYQIFVTNVGNGSFRITFATTGGTTTEQPVFGFSVIKAVTS